MAKKRTKKQKQTAKHRFTLSWEPSNFEAKSQRSVNRQFENELNSTSSKSNTDKSSMDSAQMNVLTQTRRNIIKSLILGGVILGTEVVLYFFWN